MALYWVTNIATNPGYISAAAQQTQMEIAAAVSAIGWVVAAGVAYWYGSSPQYPESGFNVQPCTAVNTNNTANADKPPAQTK